MTPITTDRLKEVGFKDTTGGWGGSQGCDYHYEKDGFEIQTYDWSNAWHPENNPKIKFGSMEELQEFMKSKGI